MKQEDVLKTLAECNIRHGANLKLVNVRVGRRGHDPVDIPELVLGQPTANDTFTNAFMGTSKDGTFCNSVQMSLNGKPSVMGSISLNSDHIALGGSGGICIGGRRNARTVFGNVVNGGVRTRNTEDMALNVLTQLVMAAVAPSFYSSSSSSSSSRRRSDVPPPLDPITPTEPPAKRARVDTSITYKYVAESKAKGSLTLKDFVTELTQDELQSLVKAEGGLPSNAKGFMLAQVMHRFLGEHQTFSQVTKHVHAFKDELRKAVPVWSRLRRDDVLARTFVKKE